MAMILLCDLDQTLVDILGHVVECHRTTLGARGHAMTHAQIRKHHKRGDLHALRDTLGIDDAWFYGPDGVFRWRQDIKTSIRDGYVREIAGAQELLHEANGMGYRIAIVTNGDTYETMEKLALLGIRHDGRARYGPVSAIVTGDDAARKPDTEGALRALATLGARKEDMVVVLGDSTHDTRCAAGLRDLGWYVTSVLYDHYGNGYHREIDGWHHRVRTHKGAIRLLSRLARTHAGP